MAIALFGLLPNTKGENASTFHAASLLLRDSKFRSQSLSGGFLQFKHPLFSVHDRDGANPKTDQVHHHSKTRKDSSEICSFRSLLCALYQQCDEPVTAKFVLSARLDSREVVKEEEICTCKPSRAMWTMPLTILQTAVTLATAPNGSAKPLKSQKFCRQAL